MSRNVKIARAKIRKEITGEDEEVVPWTGWIADREAIVEPIRDEWLIQKLGIGKYFPIIVGETVFAKSKMNISAYDIQEGGTTVIVGKKGTGKSHVAKILLLGLIKHGARCVVFDINDEYGNLTNALEGKDGKDKDILKLEPGDSLKFLISYIGLDVLIKVLRIVMGTADPSIHELSRVWKKMEKCKRPITLSTLTNELEEEGAKTTKAILGAIARRFTTLEKTRLFTDASDEATTIENELGKLIEGGAIVFNLKGKSSDVRNIVVATVLSKLESLLENDRNFPPIFIFAEEAHLYIEETDWDNIVTRMRHLGTFQFYITNTPTNLPNMLIRQTDNLFLFNLMNNEDFNHIGPAAKIDNDTISSVAKALPPRTCMLIGLATKDYPFVIRTDPVKFAAGETRRFFIVDDEKGESKIAKIPESSVQDDIKESGDFSL